MTTVTLLEKAYGSFSSPRFEEELSSLLSGLKVKSKVKGQTGRNWIQIEMTGEDESVALKLLEQNIGLVPVSGDKVGKFRIVRGKIVNSEESTKHLRVDVGVFAPRDCDAKLSLQSLKAQLADGKDHPLERLIDLFCLRDFMPVQLRILSDLDNETKSWEAEFSEGQLALFSDWLKSSLDRLIVLGAASDEVNVAVQRTKHFRDVVRVEHLGPLEYAIECKLGTDAIGLIPRLGNCLPKAFLAAFSPRKIKQTIGRDSL